MKKPVIGILPISNYMLTNDSFADHYRFGNNYIKRIVNNGAIPLLIPMCDDKIIQDSLEMCNGLLIPGGFKVLPEFFKIIDYFYQSKKPIFGICLGMQMLCMYSVNKNSNKYILESANNHWPIDLFRDNVTDVVHKDFVSKDSKLYEIIGEEEIMVNSVHHYTVNDVGSLFRVSIKSEDDLIEGIEYKDDDRFIIGVQFHPEILDQFNSLFEVFINKCRK